MKIIKSISLFLVMLSIFSCEKHKLLYDTTTIDENTAEFQLHYFEPITSSSAYYIDSVLVNDILCCSEAGSNQLTPYNGSPGGTVGRFFTATAGSVNFKMYRGGELIYNRDVTLEAKKQNVFFYDFDEAPAVVDNGYPYWDKDRNTDVSAEDWDTDSICKVKFINMLYEEEGVPYQGKIQYQYRDDYDTSLWVNIGDPVAFGETTVPSEVPVRKWYTNSSGYSYLYYRILDENGDVLQTMKSSGTISDYSLYRYCYIGRVYMHIFAGIRTSTPIPAMYYWTSL